MLLCEKERKDNWELDNYFMNPTYIDNIGLVYPIKLKNYNSFIKLANEYILLDVKKKNNLIRQTHEKAVIEGNADRKSKPKLIDCDNIFDWYVSQIISIDESLLNSDVKYLIKIKERMDVLSEEDKQSILSEIPEVENILNTLEFNKITFNKIKEQLRELFQYIVHHEVVFNLNLKRFDILNNNELYGFIDRNNFYEFRDVVMKQNIMHEPRIAPNLRSQKSIDRENKVRFKDENSLETMVALVSVSINKDISDYSYYRLTADYKSILNKLEYINTAIYRANGNTTTNGGSIPPMNILEPLKLNKNPYISDASYLSEDDIKRVEQE